MKYEIRVEGTLDQRWSMWFDGMRITAGLDGVTVMVGDVVDQAVLHGHLTKIRDLGLSLVLVRRIDSAWCEEGSDERDST